MAMFAEDAEFELEGETRLRRRRHIRRIFGCAGVNGEIHLVDCAIKGDAVTPSSD